MTLQEQLEAFHEALQTAISLAWDIEHAATTERLHDDAESAWYLLCEAQGRLTRINDHNDEDEED